MENTVSKNGISGYTLKMIAVITMLIDHVGATIVERYLLTNGMLYGAPLVIYYVMRGIGRLAFPIYCYFIVQGFTYTRSRAKYALRLFVFALASELPFDMALWNSTWDMNHNNVFWTLLLGLLTIWALDVFGNKLVFLDKSKSSFRWFAVTLFRCIVMTSIVLASMFIAQYIINSDYGASGVATIVAMYLLKNYKLTGYGVAVVILGLLTTPLAWLSLLVLIPLKFYNGTRGKQPKYFFYLFYPVHLLVLWLICHMMGLGI